MTTTIDPHFNNYISIMNNRMDDLTKISINERKQYGNGILFLNFTNKEKLDVFYISLYNKETGTINESFPKELINYLIDKIKSVPPSVIFFNIFDKDKNMNIECDLEKDSEYTQYCLKNSDV